MFSFFNKSFPVVKIFIFGLCLVIISCSEAPMDIESEFENLFAPHFSEDEPGGVILVKKGDEILFLESYGLADLETGEKITPHTVFNTGSVSKTIVSYGILLLRDDGLLSLDDPIALYFDDFENEEIAQKVTIRHLMTHTSGLPDSRKVNEEFEFYLTAKDEENFEPIKQTTELNFEPGSRFQYSNPAFNGLALIIEKVSGQKWQDYITTHIFDLAGMKETTITDGPHPRAGVAHAYELKEDTYTESDYGEVPTFAAAGNGGVWCSIRDLEKYEKALQNSIFLKKATIDLSRTPVRFPNWSSPDQPDVGLSWFLAEKDHPSNIFGAKIISHTGWQGGFRAFHISIPEKQIFYAGLFNRPLPHLKESYNPFTDPVKNKDDVRVKGIRILQEHGWLD